MRGFGDLSAVGLSVCPVPGYAYDVPSGQCLAVGLPNLAPLTCAAPNTIINGVCTNQQGQAALTMNTTLTYVAVGIGVLAAVGLLWYMHKG